MVFLLTARNVMTMLRYVIRRNVRWLITSALLAAAYLLTGGKLRAVNATSSAATNTATYSGVTGLVTYSYSFPANGYVAGESYGVWLYRVATGPAGGNQYAPTVTYYDTGASGGGSGSGTIAATVGQWYRVSARMVDGSGTHDVNMWLEITTEALKQITWPIPANTTSSTVNWAVLRVSDGTIMGSMSQSPGAASTFLTVANLPESTGTGDYTLKYWLPGLGFNAGSGTWIGTTTTGTVGSPGTLPTAETVMTIANAVGGDDIRTSGSSVDPAHVAAVTGPVLAPAVPPVPGGTGGTVWIGAPTGVGLTDSVYKEGVDRQVDAILKVRDAVSSGGVVGTATMTAKGVGDASTTETQAAGGATAKTAAEASFSGVPTNTAASGGSGSAPNWVFTMPGSSATVNVNPFTSERFAGVCAWFKSALSWLLGVWLFTIIANHVASGIRGMSQAQQAKGNPIIAGTGAQATAAAAALIMSGIILLGIVAVVALATQDYGLGTMASVWTANPYSGLTGGVAYMLDQTVNLAHVALFLLAKPLAVMAIAKIFAAVSAAVRFVTP